MTPPVRTDIVLLGGGHAHVHVLTAFAKLPEPGVRITLITRDLETPYSGMLPGVVAGLYQAEEAHIDLVRLGQFGEGGEHMHMRGAAPEQHDVGAHRRCQRARQRPRLPPAPA